MHTNTISKSDAVSGSVVLCYDSGQRCRVRNSCTKCFGRMEAFHGDRVVTKAVAS